MTQNSICDFGRKARDFALKGIDGKTYTLADARGPKSTLVPLQNRADLHRCPLALTTSCGRCLSVVSVTAAPAQGGGRMRHRVEDDQRAFRQIVVAASTHTCRRDYSAFLDRAFCAISVEFMERVAAGDDPGGCQTFFGYDNEIIGSLARVAVSQMNSARGACQ